VLGYTTLGEIENLKQVAVLVKAHHEDFAGSGFPDRLRGEEIPLGARIIHAASAYDDLVSRFGLPRPQVLQHLQKRAGSRFDPEVVFHLQEALQSADPASQEEAVLPLSKLRPGMVLSRNLKTVSGRLLLPEKAVLREAHIEKIQNFSKIDPIDGGIYVYLSES
jgi:putative two-component system response regulator